MYLKGKKVLVMGLGLHGGGLESARFALKRGAEVAITDLRSEEVLKPSIEKLEAIYNELNQTAGSVPKVRYIIGRHDIKDFKNADIVIKNPGVKPDSPFLQAAKRVETDISLFLRENPARLFAVTGTKGKSGTASALFHILQETSRGGAEARRITNVYLGGNITVSPLAFLDELTPNDDVVLELSSFQLGDLKGRANKDGSPLLKPAAAVITAIMADHLDRYASMEEYVNDKRVIYRGQDSSCATIAYDDEWGRSFLAETKGRPVLCPLLNLNADDAKERKDDNNSLFSIAKLQDKLLPNKLLVPGEHQKINMLAAALAAYYVLGENRETAEAIKNALASYKGIEHRLEFFYEENGVKFFNDSAATIPEAAAACVGALAKDAPLVLVTGGTDKNLDFSPLAEACSKAGAVILLEGTGSEKLAKLLDEKNISYSGPFNNLDEAVSCALNKAKDIKINAPSSVACINAALSPGCASFGMFLNEFDRGRRWKDSVTRHSNDSYQSKKNSL